MELFKQNITIDQWVSIYIGLNKNWINSKELFDFIEFGNVEATTEEYSQLLSVEHDNLKLIQKIESFSLTQIEDFKTHLGLDNKLDINLIPEIYFSFWEAEMLQRIIVSDAITQDKLEKVAHLHSDFNYTSSWNSFIYFMPPTDGIPVGNEKLYDNLLKYTEEKIDSLKF